jgi:hypothetical protein
MQCLKKSGKIKNLLDFSYHGDATPKEASGAEEVKSLMLPRDQGLPYSLCHAVSHFLIFIHIL